MKVSCRRDNESFNTFKYIIVTRIDTKHISNYSNEYTLFIFRKKTIQYVSLLSYIKYLTTTLWVDFIF